MNENLVPNMGSIKTPDDWKCIRSISLNDKFMQDEIELVKRVLDRCDMDAYNIGTLHGIVASTIHPIEPDYGYMPVRQLLVSHLRQDKAPVLDAMKGLPTGCASWPGKFGNWAWTESCMRVWAVSVSCLRTRNLKNT